MSFLNCIILIQTDDNDAGETTGNENLIRGINNIQATKLSLPTPRLASGRPELSLIQISAIRKEIDRGDVFVNVFADVSDASAQMRRVEI